MFDPAAGPVKSTRKPQMSSVLSLQGQVNRLWNSFELVGDKYLFTCSESILIFINETGNDVF